MGFSLVQSDVIKRSFEIVAPDDSVLKVTDCEFKYMANQAYLDLVKEKGNDVINTIVVGWDGFEDEQGNNLEFSPENLALVAQEPFVLNSLFDVYTKAISGFDRKNWNASQLNGLNNKAARRKKTAKKKKASKRS